MEIGTYGYEKSELLTLAEQIYQCKHDIEDLELELNEVQFHYTYIGKRKDIVTHEVIFRLLFILICTGILYGCVVVPIMLKIAVIAAPPTNTENIVFQLAIPVTNKITAPIKIAITEVSPIDPGINPTK